MSQKTYKDYMDIEVINYSNKELEFIYGELSAEYDDYTDKWAKEVADISTDDFDPYSFFGERKLKKITKKYAGTLADINSIIGIVADELNKREKVADEERYIGKGQFNSEDKDTFLEREKMKTISYKHKDGN